MNQLNLQRIDSIKLPNEFKLELFKSSCGKYFYRTDFLDEEMEEITAFSDEKAKYLLRTISDLIHEAGLFLPQTV